MTSALSVFDVFEGAGSISCNDKEDLDEVAGQVGWIKDSKQSQSTAQYTQIHGPYRWWLLGLWHE